MLGFQIRWDWLHLYNLVIMAVTHWANNFHTRKLPQSSFFCNHHQYTSIHTFQTQQLKGLPFFFSLINLHQPALFMEGHPWLSPPLLLSVISWTGVKVSFKPQALTAKWQLWHTAATSVHICIAKSSSIILHYLSLESSCLSQLNAQREFFYTCQSPFQHSLHMLTDGTWENISGELPLRQLFKATIFIMAQHLVSKLNWSEVKCKNIWNICPKPLIITFFNTTTTT